jgi:hypothetical protein
MSNLRSMLISTLTLSLLACATASAPPEAGPGIERLSPGELARLLPKAEPKLPLAELVRMSNDGVTSQDIIARIRETGSRYELSASQAIELHSQGVSAQVLDHIQSAHEQAWRERIAEEIDRREQRHTEELKREQWLWRSRFCHDPRWPVFPGSSWHYGYPFLPYGSIYLRR